MMSEGVKLFLRNLNLEQYYDMFVAKGFDLDSDICHLNSDDLDAMYIAEEDHRKQILEAGMPCFQKLMSHSIGDTWSLHEKTRIDMRK